MPNSTEDLLNRGRKIAELIVLAETNKPGSIRVQTNNSQMRVAIQMLREIGYKKPFFASSQQFVIDCFLTYNDACATLLPYCLLTFADDERRRHMWNGSGGYMFWLWATPRFNGSEQLFFAVNLDPVFDMFTDFLDPLKTSEEYNGLRIRH